MRVLVAAVSSSSHPSGVQRHAFNVVRSLLSQAGISAIDLVLAPWQREMVQSLVQFPEDERLTVHFVPVAPGAMGRNRWYYFHLPRLATAFASSIVHFTYPVPLQRGAFGCPVLVTLHDLYPHQIPANFGLHKALFNVLILQQCLRAADAIACVSDSTRQALRRYVPAEVSRRALRIYNCVEPAVDATGATPWPGEFPFLLCVAQHRRKKNLVFLLRVFALLLRAGRVDPALRLVIVGIAGPETRRIQKTLGEESLQGKVLLMEGITEQALQWCYRLCRLVLAPSTAEGFGLPVVEALLAGAGVVCSDIPAFREFGGSHCRYVPLNGAAMQTFADAIVAALGMPRQAPMRMSQLSAQEIGKQYVCLYSQLLCGSRQDRSWPALSGEADFAAKTLKQEQESKNGEETEMDHAGQQRYAQVLGTRVNAVNMEAALSWVRPALKGVGKAYVCVAGVHGVMEAERSPVVARAFAGASLTIPDGMPLVWVGRLQGHAAMRRVTGPDIMLEIFRRKEFSSVKHYLYGGRQGVAEELRARMLAEFPWVQIVGVRTPPYHDLLAEEEGELIQEIAALKPDILWIGLGCPRQELFMARYQTMLETRLMFGVGAAFDYHTGRIQDCAEWIKLAGLQWAHRLVQDPKRLWKRYLRNNPWFVYQIARQICGLRPAVEGVCAPAQEKQITVRRHS